MRVLLIFLLSLASSFSRAGDIEFYDIVINIGDGWRSQETASGVEVSISKDETLSLSVMQAPEEPTKDQIHGKSNPKEFSSWGEFYGSTSQGVDSVTGKTKHSWLLYNGNYILLVQYTSENPKSLNLVRKYLGTLKRVAP